MGERDPDRVSFSSLCCKSPGCLGNFVSGGRSPGHVVNPHSPAGVYGAGACVSWSLSGFWGQNSCLPWEVTGGETPETLLPRWRLCSCLLSPGPTRQRESRRALSDCLSRWAPGLPQAPAGHCVTRGSWPEFSSVFPPVKWGRQQCAPAGVRGCLTRAGRTAPGRYLRRPQVSPSHHRGSASPGSGWAGAPRLPA